MKKIFLAKFFILLWFMLIPLTGLRAQLIERPNNDTAKPLSFGFTSISDDVVISPDDLSLITNEQDQINIIDTSFFGLASPQPEALEDRTESYVFLPNSQSLFIPQVDAFITRLLADDPLNDILTVDLAADLATGAARVVIDEETADNHLYLLTYSDEFLSEYDISTRSIVNSVQVIVEGVTGLNDLVYITLPALGGGNVGGDTDKIAITTDNSRVIFFDENLNLLTSLILVTDNDDCPSEGDPNSHILPSAALNTNRDLLFVVNRTDNVVHVVDVINNTQVDTDPNEGGVNSICLNQVGPGDIDQETNSNLRDIVVTRVTLPDIPNAARAFVTGDSGVSILNATETDLGLLDGFDSEGENPDLKEPIPTSRNPLLITASSQSDGYLYVTNSDNSITVISEKPFVTINAINPDTVTQADPNFSVTFQVDELCTGCEYRVRANGDIDESGALLFTSTYTADQEVNTDISTPQINITDFDVNAFIEGENQVFVFSDDANGFTGRDAVGLNVDRPPTDVEIVRTDFGNQRIFITINRLTQEDIKQYLVYALPAQDQANPVCPGGLDFNNATEVATVPQTDSGDELKITVSGLDNLVFYCVGIRAEDNAGNLSPNITLATEPVLPEQTVGIVGASGETGCRLQSNRSFSLGSMAGLVFLGLVALCWQIRRILKNTRFELFIILLGFLMVQLLSGFNPQAKAVEVTDQKWSFHLQGGFYLPTDDVMDEFLTKCCNGVYRLTFGRLWKSQFEANIGVAFMLESRKARGVETNRESGDSFHFFAMPVSIGFTYRADFKENQLIVPYAGVGFDYMFFRENLQGDITTGSKWGYHALAGFQILLEFFDDMADGIEEFGINDTYLTFEGRWDQIDNFGGSGVAFTGFTFSAGLLFEF